MMPDKPGFYWCKEGNSIGVAEVYELRGRLVSQATFLEGFYELKEISEWLGPVEPYRETTTLGDSIDLVRDLSGLQSDLMQGAYDQETDPEIVQRAMDYIIAAERREYLASSTRGDNMPSSQLPIAVNPNIGNVRLPSRAHPTSAGLDLFTDKEYTIHPGQAAKIYAGFSAAIPVGFYGKIEGRSSLAARSIIPAGGVIDSEYRGPIVVVLLNLSGISQTVGGSNAIAQLVILPCELLTPRVVDSLPETDRKGGFGTTDK